MSGWDEITCQDEFCDVIADVPGTPFSEGRGRPGRIERGTGFDTPRQTARRHSLDIGLPCICRFLPRNCQDLPGSCETAMTCLHMLRRLRRNHQRLAIAPRRHGPQYKNAEVLREGLTTLDPMASRLAVCASQLGLPRRHATLAFPTYVGARLSLGGLGPQGLIEGSQCFSTFAFSSGCAARPRFARSANA